MFTKLCGKLFLKKNLWENFSKKIVGNFFQKNRTGNFSEISRHFQKKSDRKIFGKFFPEKCGKLFRQTSRKETTENSPGTFPKNGETFRQNPLWKRVFSPQISGGNTVGSLTDPDSFPENPRGNFPGNSRKFRGENPGVFSGFFCVSRLQRRVATLKNGTFSGEISGEIL